MEIFRTSVYAKRAKKLLRDAEMKKAEQEIATDPDAWPIVAGTGGVRKARAARGSSGKSGGVRIIYYYMAKNEHLHLLDIYAKNEQDNITDEEKKFFRSIVTNIKECAQ